MTLALGIFALWASLALALVCGINLVAHWRRRPEQRDADYDTIG